MLRFYLMIYLCFVGVVVTSTTPKKKTGTSKGQKSSSKTSSGVKKSKNSHRKNAMREPSSSGKSLDFHITTYLKMDIFTLANPILRVITFYLIFTASPVVRKKIHPFASV